MIWARTFINLLKSFLPILSVTCIHLYLSANIRPLNCDIAQCGIMDFAYYMGFINGVWNLDIERPYSLEGNQQFMTHLLGFLPASGMPIGLFPSSIFLLAPFGWIFTHDQLLSFRLYIALGILFLSWALTSSLRNQYPSWTTLKSSFVASLIVMVVLLMPAGRLAVAHGQTSLFAVASLLLLAHRNIPTWGRVLLICLLSIKPTYCFLGISLILLQGRWRDSLFSMGAIGALCVATLVVIGVQGWVDYLTSLKVFAVSIRSIYYAPAFGNAEITTLPFLFRQFTDHVFAARITLFFQLLILASSSITVFFSSCWRIYYLLGCMALLWITPNYIGQYEDILTLCAPFLLASLHPYPFPLLIGAILFAQYSVLSLTTPFGVIGAAVCKIWLLVYLAFTTRKYMMGSIKTEN